MAVINTADLTGRLVAGACHPAVTPALYHAGNGPLRTGDANMTTSASKNSNYTGLSDRPKNSGQGAPFSPASDVKQL